MMRLPSFRYYRAASVAEAARILAEEGRSASLLAGGTDLLPKMKRGQRRPKLLVALHGIAALRSTHNGDGLMLGAGLTLADVVANDRVRSDYAALWQAASQVATSQIRNTATLGGNLCVDTRCAYHDQSHDWRKAIGFCLKQDGETCWASPASERCWAVSSTDTAPALAALGAGVRLVSAHGERVVALIDLHRDDGAAHLTSREDEILTEIQLPAKGNWRSAYWKLRRRGAYDFPVLSVAAAADIDGDGVVRAARINLGAVTSKPIACDGAAALLTGNRLSDELIAEAAAQAGSHARPKENTDASAWWRRRMVAPIVTWALRELRGDDMRDERRRLACRPMGSEA
ncbi:MAG TPA: FAD binding domain-containing protein, partial [Woeseiaceae bacterium]|nr:FAD binding domain-containing protein [Woeseiaceae bacterium]